MIVRHGAQRAARLGVLREQRQRDNENGCDDRGPDVQHVDIHAEIVVSVFFRRPCPRHVLPPERPARRDADVKPLDLGVPHQIAEALHEEGEADGGHEQEDGFLIHQMLEDVSFHRPGECEHHHHGQDDRDKGIQLPPEMVIICAEHRIDEMREGHLPFLQPHQRHRRKQRHDALRVVEDSRRLEDQHEAKGDEGIHDPGHQTVQDHLDRVEKCWCHLFRPQSWATPR